MDIQQFAMIGISHEDLSMEEREEFLKQKPKQWIEKLWQEKKIQAYVDLSTCLRVEFYIELPSGKNIEDCLSIFPMQKGLQCKQGEEALDYLYRVICGFFSVIKGEDQILSQVKTAYQNALEEGHSSKLFNIIFHKAIHLGKKFRTESEIAKHALSLEAITLHSIKEHFPNWKEKKVLLLGVGELTQSLLALLVKEKEGDIYVTNRSYHKALQLSNFYHVNVIDFREKYTWVGKADIIISATSAPHLVIEKKRFLPFQEDKEYLFVDLAVPRDIEQSIGQQPQIQLLNLDDIWEISRQHSCFREQLLEDYAYLIEEQQKATRQALAYYQKGEAS